MNRDRSSFAGRITVRFARIAHRPWLHLLLILLACAGTFANTLENSLQLDDAYRVASNPEVKRFWPPWRHFLDPRTSTSLPTLEQYRPLLPLSLSLNNELSDRLGIELLAGYHLGNLGIHLAVCWLVYLLFSELLLHWSGLDLGGRRLRGIALAGTLLFAIHPVSGVPVNYISARDLLLMMLFLTVALLVYLRMRRRGASVAGWTLALGLSALSILAKQNSVVMPLLVLLFELGPAKSRWRSPATWARPAAFALVMASYFAWTRLVLASSDLAMVTSPGRSSGIYLLTMLRLHLFHYARNVIWPFRRRPQPEVVEAGALFDPGVIAGLSFILASLFLVWRLRRRAPVASWSTLAYWVLFIPTSSLWPFYHLAVDYRQYPSLAFLCLALAIGLTVLLPARAFLVVLLLAVYLGISSYILNGIWRTEESFWAQSVRYGATPLGHMNYARSIQGRDPARAERHYLEALQRAPGHVYTHINLGMHYLATGRPVEGLAHARRAAEIAPGWAIAHHWLSKAYRHTGDIAGAQAESRIAADLDPRNLEYQYQAAYDLYDQGELEAMLLYLERVAERDPGHRLTLFLQGVALQQLGRWSEAEASYRRFLKFHPGYAQAWFNLAHGLMSAGRCDEAVAGFEEALRLDAADQSAAHHWLEFCQR
ncbi:MAG: tetratricopeptide repeat protein [bacterium]|nr:tetratricopeptide repeat protein [bacterium]